MANPRKTQTKSVRRAGEQPARTRTRRAASAPANVAESRVAVLESTRQALESAISDLRRIDDTMRKMQKLIEQGARARAVRERVGIEVPGALVRDLQSVEERIQRARKEFLLAGLRDARQAGVETVEIARALGVTRQRVHQLLQDAAKV